jgi:hypothetical protein
VRRRAELALNVTFAQILTEYWKHAGLAFSTVIAEGFNGLMLVWFLRRRLGPFGLRGILAGLGRALAAAAAMAAVAWFAEREITTWLYVYLPHKAAQIVGVPTAIALGAGVYFGLARVCRFPELGFVAEALRARSRRRPPRPRHEGRRHRRHRFRQEHRGARGAGTAGLDRAGGLFHALERRRPRRGRPLARNLVRRKTSSGAPARRAGAGADSL